MERTADRHMTRLKGELRIMKQAKGALVRSRSSPRWWRKSRPALVHQDVDDPNRVLLVEYWDSKEAFMGPHLQTPHMQAFLERANGFLAAAPEFRFGKEIAAAR